MNGFFAARFGLTGALLAAIGAAFLALVALLGVQTARIEGFKVWPFKVTGWKPLAEARGQTIADMIKAQGEAAKLARAQRQAQEATYSAIAERIDDNAQDTLQTALAAADRFVAAGGMRAQAAGSAPCNTRTAARDRSAEDPFRPGRATQLDAAGAGAADSGPAGALVSVTAEDIRICTVNTVKAEAGHDLALQLQEASAPQK